MIVESPRLYPKYDVVHLNRHARGIAPDRTDGIHDCFDAEMIQTIICRRQARNRAPNSTAHTSKPARPTVTFGGRVPNDRSGVGPSRTVGVPRAPAT